MDKKIYFIVNNKKSGSSLLRAYQIKEKLDIFKKKFISKNIRNMTKDIKFLNGKGAKANINWK